MPKCEHCGKEVLFPFKCPYCNKAFCVEHRLPETHKCPNLPKDPMFWYQKRKLAEEKALYVKDKLGICPKCSSSLGKLTDYDAKTATFKCKKCGHRYAQLKAFPHKYINPKDE